MSTYHVKKGRNIELKGSAIKEIIECSIPERAAVIPPSFRNAKFRVLVKPDDKVKVGTPILEEKTNTDIKVVSPVSGKVEAIYRGKKRALMQVVILTDGKQTAEKHNDYRTQDISKLGKDKVIAQMLAGGLWPCVRQRPFSRIANPTDTPKSIFVHAMNTEPLALDVDLVLEGQKEEFEIGLNLLSKLTDGDVHVCAAQSAQSEALTHIEGANYHYFSGDHPTGNISTHIHYVDPINKGDLVWYVEALDVIRLARLFTTGSYHPETYVALTGEGIINRKYAQTIQGVQASHIAEYDKGNYRVISGSVLNGSTIGADGFVGFYDTQITAIPEGGEREFLGWLMPGFGRYTFSNTYISAFLNEGEASLDCDKHGSDRAIVLNHLYDKYNTLDIMTYFLLRAVISGDIEESEKLGILECDEEDFALATFACPSKVDVGGIIREGLDLIEQEG